MKAVKSKMTGKKWALILLPTIIGGIAIVYFLKKYSTAKASSIKSGTTPAQGTGNNNTPPSQTPAAGCQYPLKTGSQNSCVKQLQEFLIYAYGPSILPKYGADGKWGSETQGAFTSAFGRTQINSEAELAQCIGVLVSIKIATSW